MSNIKSYLQRAILKIGSHASTHAWQSIHLLGLSDIEIDDNRRYRFTYTAPADGFFYLFAQDSQFTYEGRIGCDITVNSHPRITTHFNDDSTEVHVAKGASITLNLFNLLSTPAQFSCMFIYSVGGTY